MIDLVQGTPEGIRDSTALTAGTTRSYDLSAWAERTVKLIVDQNCLVGFSSHAHDNAAGPGDFYTGDRDTTGLKVIVAGVDVGFAVIGDDVDAGAGGFQRWIDPSYPFMLVRPKAVNTALIKIKPTSRTIPSPY